eukprot:Pgem_evm1s7861
MTGPKRGASSHSSTFNDKKFRKIDGHSIVEEVATLYGIPITNIRVLDDPEAPNVFHFTDDLSGKSVVIKKFLHDEEMERKLWDLQSSQSN